MSDVRKATSRLDVETAIIDAQGAAAVMSVIQMELVSSTSDGWKALGLDPQKGVQVLTMSESEHRALHYAMDNLQDAVAKVARLFYAETKEQAHV